MADWHHSLISWPGGGGQPDAQSKRLTETRSGKQIRNCYILPQFTHIFATPGCLFGDFSKRGPKFCGKCTTCFVIDFFVLSQAEKQEETVNKYKGWCKRSVSNCISKLQLISWPQMWENKKTNGKVSPIASPNFLFGTENTKYINMSQNKSWREKSVLNCIFYLKGEESLWSKLFSLSQELHLQTKVYIQHQSWACSWKEDKTLVFDIQYFFSTAFLGSLTNVLTLRRHVSISTKNKGEWKKGKLTHFSNRSLAYRETMHGDKTGAKDWFFWIYISKAAFLLHTSMNICTG